MTSEIHNIFNQSSCLTSSEIEQYVSGTLSENDIRRVELHLADCPMCSDELDGYVLLKDKNNLPGIISDINSRIDEKIHASKQISLKPSRTLVRKRIFSIAASLILLIGAGFIIKFYINTSNNNLAEVPAGDEMQVNKESETIKPETKEFDKTVENETDDIQKTAEISNSKTIEPVLSEKSSDIQANSGSITPVKTNGTAITGNSEETEDTAVDEVVADIENGDEADFDQVIVTEEKKSENNDEVVSGIQKNMKAKTESEQPKEDIAFMTTRGGTDLRNKKTANRKEVEKYTSLRESALLSYNMKIWDEALKDFNNYLKYKPNDYEILYKSGISNYNLKKYNKAVIQFDKVAKEGINRYVENAEWYEVKSLVKLGKNDEAKVILNKIIVKNGKYQNKALDLLNTLD